MELFKKGQLVPKRLGMVTCHKKQRQHIKFGTDVAYDHSTKTAHVFSRDGYIMVIHSNSRGVKTNNGTFKKMSPPSSIRIMGRLSSSAPQQEVK
ncbi:hypothetical protein DPF84_04630 [Enterobacter hormaechei]|uniref:hypothetical protein n=1 Tax=Enterobacter hormaechei TaxID=158836 RepID=UPI000DBF13CE|nr:hypothetical protein [Enterobacter hormaechei]AWX01076.1 hypothetical protein DPF84_04630 [Enterobacter hormaechei]MCL8147043.1 hypothetical protein [Enterobacter hormaechei]MCM7929608.1 hypothetical protein [Enterobacter hormaechei]MCM7949183.1 hypothetical protein [Enterobacter hormaechei]RAM39847.1 hypothetical protein DOZ52_27030 [Enterobacter hormaechei]